MVLWGINISRSVIRRVEEEKEVVKHSSIFDEDKR
jgi:hypothetical protein